MNSPWALFGPLEHRYFFTMSAADPSTRSVWPSGTSEVVSTLDDLESRHSGTVSPLGRTSLEARINQALGQRGLSLRFPKGLEERFIRGTDAARQRLVARRSVVGALLYAGMLLADVFLVPDRLQVAIFLRLVIFLPCCLAGIWLLKRLRKPVWREWLLGFNGILATVICLVVTIPSTSPWASAYLGALALIVVYSESVLRMRFLPAAALCVVICAGQLYGLLTMPHVGVALFIPIMLLLGSVILFSLYGSYTLERAERSAFLLGLRQRVLRAKLRHANERLRQHARLDPLTEVSNRRQFDEFITQAWDHAAAHGQPLSLMMLDVDHFKGYNDRYGHPAGDRCLNAVAQVAAACVRRPGDLFSRYGGEEFAVVLPGKDLPASQDVAERMRAAVQACQLLHEASSCAPVVTVSVGLATCRPSASIQIKDLMAAADAALYQAKAAGRNRVQVQSVVAANPAEGAA